MGRSVDLKEGQTVDLMEALKVGHSVGHSVGQMVGQMVGRTEDRSVDLKVAQTVDRSVDLKVAPKEDLMEAHLGGLQDLSEVRAALHRFAQLVLVLVQARLPVLRALVVPDLEWVFV